MRVYKNLYPLIVSPENLFIAWEIFKRDKQRKEDVLEFGMEVEKKIFQLRRELANKTYRHGPYTGFWICDPKRRRIHKATVRDRIVHHALFRVLNNVFEPTFIPASFSCRIGKGTHKGVRVVANMIRKESQNHTRTCWALKCDIRKFFDSIDHEILLGILEKKVIDANTRGLLTEIVGSFSASETLFERKGVPIGNLTSQLFANVYMNEFDQFMKRVLKVRNYARYTDDFLVLSADRAYLEEVLRNASRFLQDRLQLELHPKKISIRKCTQGVDFLGYVILPHQIVPRTRTKRRIFKKLRRRVVDFKKGTVPEATMKGSLDSYLGFLGQADAKEISDDLKNKFWFWVNE